MLRAICVCTIYKMQSLHKANISNIASAFASRFQEGSCNFEREQMKDWEGCKCVICLYIIIASLETFLESHSLAVGRYGFCQLLSSLYFVSTSKIKISVYSARADRNEILYTYVYMYIYIHVYVHIYI